MSRLFIKSDGLRDSAGARGMSDVDLNAATTHDLLERYVGLMDSARHLAERYPDQSRVARENAEAIAAEIERRCVR